MRRELHPDRFSDRRSASTGSREVGGSAGEWGIGRGGQQDVDAQAFPRTVRYCEVGRPFPPAGSNLALSGGAATSSGIPCAQTAISLLVRASSQSASLTQTSTR